MKKILSLAATALLSLVIGLAKSAQAQDYIYAIGNPSFSVNVPIDNGYINVANGNIHLEFPLGKQPQRGSFQHSPRLVYDSRIWQIVQNGNYLWMPTNVPDFNSPSGNSMGGWRFISDNEAGSINFQSYSSSPGGCSQYGNTIINTTYDSITYTDTLGIVHPFDLSFTTQDASACPMIPVQSSAAGSYASDSSGYYFYVTVNGNSVTSETVYDKNGSEVYPQTLDRNGNFWSQDSSGNPIDTLGLMPIKITNTTNPTCSGCTGGDVIDYDVLTEGGTYARYIVTTEPINVNTQFGQTAVNEYQGSLTAIQSIQLPDGSMYSFTYDKYFGDLASMTLPTGGKTMYTFGVSTDSFQNNNRWLGFVSRWDPTLGNTHGWIGVSPVRVLSNCTISGGTATGCEEQDTVTDMQGNDTVYTFTLNSYGSWNTVTDVWRGSSSTSTGTKLLTTNPTYNFNQPCGWVGCNGAEDITKLSETVTLWDAPGGPITSLDRYQYDSRSGNPTLEQEWDYYGGTSSNPPTSTPTRETDYSYNEGVNYALFTTQETKYFNGSPFSQTTYHYDETPVVATSGLPGHTAVSEPRGNVTSVLRGLPNPQATTSYSYDDAGMVISSTDANGYTTAYVHSCSDAYLSQTTYPAVNGISRVTHVNPDCSSGDPVSMTDQNGLTTYYGYNDSFGRKTSVSFPDGGGTTYSYTPKQMVETKSISSTTSSVRTTTWDIYGQKSQVTQSDTDGNDTVNYSYDESDVNGPLYSRKECISNPQRGVAPATSGISTCVGVPAATTIYDYDALNRPTQVTHVDGSKIQVSYAGNQATVTDESGHQKIYTYDAFHDLTKVLEPNASGTPTWETDYTYDGAGHVTGVTQIGDGSSAPQTRSFHYNSLGELTTQTTPESGTTSYTIYDGNGNLKSKTDARTITTNYRYDALNRLISKTYVNDSSGTPSSCFQYDPPGGIGHLASEWTQMGACPTSPPTTGVLTRRTVLAYDPMGRVLSEQQCTPTNCTSGAPFSPTYSYDLAGDILSSTNGVGNISLTNTYDAAGHLGSVTSSWNDATHPPTLFSAPGYDPAGNLTSATFGAGLSLSRTYDSRFRLSSEADTGSPVPTAP